MRKHVSLTFMSIKTLDAIFRKLLLPCFLLSFLVANGQLTDQMRQEAQQRILQAETHGQSNFCGAMEEKINQQTPEDIQLYNRLSTLRGNNTTWNLRDGYGDDCINDCDINAESRTVASCSNPDNEIFRIPVVYTLNMSEGCGVTIPTEAELTAQITITNDFFECQDIPIEFYQSQAIRMIDAGCTYDEDNVENIPNVINVYVFANTGNGTGCNGFAFLPSSTASPNTVVMSHNCYNGFDYTSGALQANNCSGDDIGLAVVLIHEMGHYLGLYHTHQNKDNGQAAEPSDDHCNTGDFIADTCADPSIPDFGNDTDQDNCADTWNGTGNDAAYNNQTDCNQAFDNIMGYNNFSGCRTTFTECQKAKMIDALLCVRGPQACGRDVNQEFANGEDDAILNICLGDAVPTFTARSDCYHWYDDIGADAITLASNTASFTPPAGTGTGQLDVNTPGTYTWYLGDINEINPDCRTAVQVKVLPEPGTGSGNGMNAVQVSNCNAAQNIGLSTNATVLTETEVIGWWLTETNPISTNVTDDASLNTALNSATIGGTLSNTFNHIFESTSGTPTTAFTLPFDCSSLNTGTTYYATPLVATSKAAVPDENCEVNAGPTSNIAFNGHAAKYNSIDPDDVCRPQTVNEAPNFMYCIEVSGYTGNLGNLSIIIRDDGVNGNTIISDWNQPTGDATYCYSQADLSAYDPGHPDWTTGLTAIVWEQGGEGMANANISSTLDITYSGEPAIPFPTVTAYSDCLFGDAVQINCNCGQQQNNCPTPVMVDDEDGVVCTGGGTADFDTWKTAVENANPLDANQDPDELGTLVYSSITPVAGQTPPNNLLPNGNHSGIDNCQVETQTAKAYIYCDRDDSGTINTGDTYSLISTYELTVYPAIQEPTITENGCEVTVTTQCMDVVTLSNPTVATGTISNNTSTSVTYTAQPGDMAGMVEINISSVLIGNPCIYQTRTIATPACSMDCPVSVMTSDDTGKACNGGGTDDFDDWKSAVETANPLDANQDPNELGTIVYSSITPTTNGTAPDGVMPNGNHSGNDNCVAETQTVMAYLYCDADNNDMVNDQDTYTLISTYELTVYPAIQEPTIVTNMCEITITGQCMDIITLSNQTVSNGMISNNGTNEVTYTAQPDDPAGMVDVSISSSITGSTCTYTNTIATTTANCVETDEITEVIDNRVEDPCSCTDPLNVSINGKYLFHDVLTAIGTPDKVVKVIQGDNEFRDGNDQVISLPIIIPQTSPGSGIYEMDFYHETGKVTNIMVQMDDDPATNIPFSSSSCDVTDCPAQIPTMSQWGLLVFALLMLNISVMFIYRMQLIQAGALSVNGKLEAQLNKNTIGKNFMVIFMTMAFGFLWAIFLFDYQIMPFDLPGSVITAGLLAYLKELVDTSIL